MAEHYYIGCNRGDTEAGIFLLSFTDQQPTLEKIYDAPHATWLTLSHDAQRLYVGSFESRNNKESQSKEGEIISFTITEGQALHEEARYKSFGRVPCHVWADETVVLVANYRSAKIASYSISENGELVNGQFFQHQGSSINEKRQEAAHAHQIVVSPDGKFAYSCDLGSDSVVQYEIKNKQLHLVDDSYQVATLGSGPRHAVFHPYEALFYVLNELSGTLDIIKRDLQSGSLMHHSSLDLPGEMASDLRWHNNYLYAALRSNNKLVCLDMSDALVPTIKSVHDLGGRPRGFAISDNGNMAIVGNEFEDALEIYQRDNENGALGERLYRFDMPSPVCVCSAQYGHKRAVHGFLQ